MFATRCGRDTTPLGSRKAAATVVAFLALGLVAGPADAAPPEAGKTERVTFSHDGLPLSPADAETEGHVVSRNGRWVAFESEATNLVPGDGNDAQDVFVVDRLLGTTQLVSASSSEVKGNAYSTDPSISDNGRFVAFASDADNLVAGDTNGVSDIFVRDIVGGVTQRVSLDSSEADGDSGSEHPDISGDGFAVAFSSSSPFVLTDSNSNADVFVRDLLAGTTARVSVSSASVQGDSDSYQPSLDSDGDVVAFVSYATTLVAPDTNTAPDVFVRDRDAGTTTRVSVSSAEVSANGSSDDQPDVSASGRYVAFGSVGTNLVPGDTVDTFYGVYLRDRTLGTTEKISVRSDETHASFHAVQPSISADGSRVAFHNRTTDLVPGGSCNPYAAIRDRTSGTTFGAFPLAGGGFCDGREPTLSPDGRYVVAQSNRNDLVATPDPGDTDDEPDIYIRIMADNMFSDVANSHAFFEEISWLVDTGITTGFADDTYRPGIDVTRQAMAAFLYRQSGSPVFAAPSTPTFSDVPTTHPFFKEIEWAVAEGLADGFPDETFRPGNAITRQAMAAFLYRLAGEPVFVPPGTPTFDDVGASHPFRTEIEWMASVGLANGFPDGGFRPGEDITRQAAAAFLFRFELLGV